MLNKKTAVCISTLNEAQSIDFIVGALCQKGYRVIVVDNASTDGTAAIASKMGATVVSRSSDTCDGLASALMCAWSMAIHEGADYIIQMDAGHSHDPLEVDRFINALANGADMVIGSRFLKGSVYRGNPRRRVMSRLFAILGRLAQPGGRYSDWTSGYRGFRGSAIRQLLTYPYHAKMHGWQVEVLGRAGENLFKIAEVPITYKAGRSSFNFKVGLEALGVLLDIMHHYRPAKR